MSIYIEFKSDVQSNFANNGTSKSNVVENVVSNMDVAEIAGLHITFCLWQLSCMCGMTHLQQLIVTNHSYAAKDTKMSKILINQQITFIQLMLVVHFFALRVSTCCLCIFYCTNLDWIFKFTAVVFGGQVC